VRYAHVSFASGSRHVLSEHFPRKINKTRWQRRRRHRVTDRRSFTSPELLALLDVSPLRPCPLPPVPLFLFLSCRPRKKLEFAARSNCRKRPWGGGPTREGADRKSPPPSALFSPSAAALMKGKLRDEATTNGSSLAHISCGVGA